MGDNKVHHVSSSVNGTFVKGYVDNHRVINDPDGIARPICSYRHLYESKGMEAVTT